jgi:predicted lipase
MLKQSGGRAPDRVVLIGHSLGGAVAQLAALWATLQFPRADVRAVTFGSPRVGNAAFKVPGMSSLSVCTAFVTRLTL